MPKPYRSNTSWEYQQIRKAVMGLSPGCSYIMLALIIGALIKLIFFP
jgi:hypothetical protein